MIVLAEVFRAFWLWALQSMSRHVNLHICVYMPQAEDLLWHHDVILWSGLSPDHLGKLECQMDKCIRLPTCCTGQTSKHVKAIGGTDVRCICICQHFKIWRVNSWLQTAALGGSRHIPSFLFIIRIHSWTKLLHFHCIAQNRYCPATCDWGVWECSMQEINTVRRVH